MSGAQEICDGELRGKRVLIVGGGPFQLDIIHAARDLDLFVVVADGRGDAPGLALAHVPLVIDTRAVDQVVQAAREQRVQAVVTAASDVAVTAVAAVAEAMGLPGATPAVVRRGRDKLETYRVLREAGLAMPHTLAVRDAAEACELVQAVSGFPCVIKPRSSAGGRGVSIVRHEAELAPAIELACAASHDGSGALIQAFAGGESVGVEAFFWQGELVRAFVLNDQYERDFVSPAGHSAPSSLSPTRIQEVERAVAAWGRALGLAAGPSNFDLRLGPSGAVLIEANLRLGGNSITELIRTSWNVDLSRAALACALGYNPAALLAGEPRVPAAARLFLKRGLGAMRDGVAIVESWARHVDVLLMELTAGEPPRVNDWSILGRCIVCGRDADAAAELAREVAHDVATHVVLEEPACPGLEQPSRRGSA